VTGTVTAVMEIPKLLPWRVLVIEDDRAMQVKLQQLFESEGYGIEMAGGGADGLRLLHDTPPLVLVLDLQVADTSPRRFFEEMRFANGSVPIVVLGTSSSAMERALFLELGADDYVVKPFNERELLARVRAAMRRAERHPAHVFTFGDVQVDFRKMEVRRQGSLITMTALEFKVLTFMTRNAERAISREELLQRVWGYNNYPTTRTVDNHIMRLRQKLEPQPSVPVHFLTVHCIGYKFVPRGAVPVWM
jgi:DNA-binding response OmpR family regulator